MRNLIIGMSVAIILGVCVGLYLPVIPFKYSKYIAVAIIASLDSVFGAIASVMQKRFNANIFITGFFGNSILAIALTYLGERLNVDIYLAAIITFGNRLFINFAIIRRLFLSYYSEKVEAK